LDLPADDESNFPSLDLENMTGEELLTHLNSLGAGQYLFWAWPGITKTWILMKNHFLRFLKVTQLTL
jgi:hypothetical protein